MITVLIQALVLASAGLLSVGSITLVILLLISDRGWRNGLGYALGYTSAYTLIGISVVVLGYRSSGNKTGEQSLLLPILLMVLGSLLLWLALRNWRKPVSEEKEEPRFFSIVDKITPPKAFGFGAMVSVINFKNLALFLTALSVVILSDLPISEKIIITLLVVLVFCLSVIIPVSIYILFPKRAKGLLFSIKQFLNQHSRKIGIWAPIIFGFILLLKGISELL
ncbi:MAG: GAP family protein [Anaerolineaceae bacterium]|nr:GAP family protein [Anaerolineaceae bacterium]